MMEAMRRGMFKTAIEMFLGERLVEIQDRDDDAINFLTLSGNSGTVVPNFNGNWDIWVGEEVVYEMEHELYPLLNHTDDTELIELYDYMKVIDDYTLKYKSKLFLDIVKGSIEKILLEGRLPLEGSAIIKSNQVIYTNNHKFLISLN